jgi:hypothetical protein
LHRCIDDSVQRPVQVQIRTDLDDDPHQLFQLIASSPRLVTLSSERGLTPMTRHIFQPKR